ISFAAGVNDAHLSSEQAGCFTNISQPRFCAGGVRIDEHGKSGGGGNQFAKQLYAFCLQRGRKKTHACPAATRSIEARNETKLNRVISGQEHDRNCFRHRLGGKCRRNATSGGNNRERMGDEISGKRRQPIVLTFRPAIFDGYVSSFDIACLIETLTECGYLVRRAVGRCAVEEPDHRHRRLLRARRERPCGCAAEQRDELAAFHSITSSASALLGCQPYCASPG